MAFDRITYLEWAKSHIDRPAGGEGRSPLEPPTEAREAPFSLARSSVDHLQPSDLGLALDGMGFTTPTAFGLPELVALVARRYDVPPERLLFTAGCTLGNFLLAAALVRPGDRVLVERPGYEPLWRNVQALGGSLAWLRREADEGYAVNLRRLQRQLRTSTRLVILTNLHNPSGRFTPPEDVARIGELARRHGAHVLWDEVYLESMRPPTQPAATVDPRASLSTLSLDKSYGLGQIKVGWCIAPPAVIRRARRVGDYLMPVQAPLLERVAVRALERVDALRARSLEIARRGLATVAPWIQARPGLEWSHPDGGFIGFARFRDPALHSRVLEAALHRDGTALVAPGHYFGDPRGFRIGFGTADADRLACGLRNLGRVLDGLEK